MTKRSFLILFLWFNFSVITAQDVRIAPGPVTVTLKSEGKPVAGALIYLGGRFAATSSAGDVVFDGVPAGQYDLRIEHREFDRYDDRLTLASGLRAPINIELTPALVFDVSGVVILRDTQQPVPGAEVTLESVKVRASVQGILNGTADWNGTFRFLDVPYGTYQARTRLPGCNESVTQVTIPPAKGQLTLTMQRVTSPGLLNLKLVDSVTGSPLPGAQVVLAEAAPLGEIARAVSKNNGKVTFADLAVGRLNWSDPKGKLPVSRDRVTARIEAEGYEPTDILVSLHSPTLRVVQVNPVTPQQEVEPNNDLAQAQAIRSGAPMQLHISERGDQDVFLLRLEEPAMLHMEVGPKNPIETQLILLDAGGNPVQTASAHRGRAARIDRGVLAGTYYVKVIEWGNNGSSTEPLALTVVVNTAVDTLEPNDSVTSARRLEPGTYARGTLLPTGNSDFYRFELDRSGTARFFVPKHGLQREIFVRDEDENVLGRQAAHPGRDLELHVPLQPGRYVVELCEWGRNAESSEPYEMRFDFAADDGILDPPRVKRLAVSRTLEPGTLAGATINPLKDVDLWAIPLDSAGLLRLQARAATEIEVRVLDDQGNQLARNTAHPNRHLKLDWSAPNATIAWVEVREWGNNGWSPLPYTLNAWWEPCDELEQLGRNDTLAWATPIEPGEVLRGSVTPYGDHDTYQLELNHPGYLEINGAAPTEVTVAILNGSGQALAQINAHPNRALKVGADIQAGTTYVQVSEWGNNGQFVGDYQLATRFYCAEPRERTPLDQDPIRRLPLGQARSFTIDHVKDLDRFVCDVTEAGMVHFYVVSPTEVSLTVYDDRTGEKLTGTNQHPNRMGHARHEAKGPTRYRLEIGEWGNNNRTTSPAYILVDQAERPLVAEKIVAEVTPTDPTQVTFSRAAWKGVTAASTVSIDADGDGEVDTQVPAEGRASVRYGAEGIYAAKVMFAGADGQQTLSDLWVDAVGPRERVGVHMLVQHPLEGQTIERDAPCQVRAISYTGSRVRSIELAVDGMPTATAYRSPYTLEVPWSSLGSGEHVLTFEASDAQGHRSTLERHVTVSEYFNLMPEDGAVLTGDDLTVSWVGADFGPARVEVREQGEQEWTQAQGANARQRLVRLEDLEPGKSYQWRPLGRDTAGPVRTASLVKGLAFNHTTYGGNIKRDYDQRVAVAVRNHAEVAQTVRLECGKPDSDLLLVGFVGEGSEGAPFDLEPGQEREFLLGISAQDVIQEQHRFPIRMASEQGYCDEATVELYVKLPRVELEWTDLGRSEDGLSQRLRLTNRGDALTDFWLQGSDPNVVVSPATEHGSLLAGESKEVTVRPRLYEGFTTMSGQVIAGALSESTARDVNAALAPGQSLYTVPLIPGESQGTEGMLLAARALSGFFLDPSYVDWSRRDNPEDTDGDGRADRWSQKDELEGILWIGNDTSGDGQIDFVQADVWWDGQIDYSAFHTDEGWEQTNLVEAWLEMDLSLPWSRSTYEKHDLQMLLNGQPMGGFTDQIPEGNYSFKLPPSALKFTDAGVPGENVVELRTEHLRGGHYVVGSAFDLKTRLTSAQVWSAASSQEEAREQVLGREDLAMDQPDFSVSSGALQLQGPEEPKVGDELTISVPLRNLGAVGVQDVPVALMRSHPGGKSVELARQWIEDVPLVGETLVTFPWTAGAGDHTLSVVVDPDNELGDWSTDNNVALINVQVAGDDAQPELTLEGLDAGAILNDSLFSLQAQARDDAGIARLEAAIDDGLWQDIPATDGQGTIKGLLQPGRHQVRVRATDTSGNRVQQELPLQVEMSQPELEILEPASGASIDQDRTDVRVQVGDNVVKAMVRVNDGPWIKAPITDGVAAARVPVGFGRSEIEAQAIDDRGVRRSSQRPIQNSWQPTTADDGFQPDYVVDDSLEIDGLGSIDLLSDPDFIFQEPSDSRAVETSTLTPTESEEVPDLWAYQDPDNDAALLSPGSPPSSSVGGSITTAGTAQVTDTPKPAGGMVAARNRESSWYCTNRPKIKVPFRLPDWLMRKNLPVPGTKQYQEMVQQLLEQLRTQGVDTSRLERFQQYLEKAAMQIEDPREMPGWLESVGLSGGAEVNQAALERRREQMLQRTQAWWLRLLASGDPQLIAQGLRARAEAFGKFDQGLQTESQAAADMVVAHQTLIEDLAEGLPVAGEMMDLYAVVTGERILNGQQISDLERVIRAGGLVAPLALEQLFKRSKLAQKGAEALTEKLSVMGQWGKKTLAELADIPPSQMDDFLAKAQKVLTTEISYTRWKQGRSADRARRAFMNTADGASDLARNAEDMSNAKNVIRQLGETGDDVDFEKRVFSEFQTNKTAQRLINSDIATDDLRRRVNQTLRGVYDKVDDASKNQIHRIINAGDNELAEIARQSGRKVEDLKRFRDKVQDIARKNNVDPGELRISTDDFSANADTKVGRDRDVTFFVDDAAGNHLTDVHHDISKSIYEENLWKRTRGTDVAGDAADMARHAEELDQMVTSRWHPEAYNSGDSTFKEFLNTGNPPTVTRLDDIRDTISVKSEHWWHMAAREADPIRRSQQIAEGMRQATKQWDRIIEPRVGRYLGDASLASKVKIPTDLELGIEIFRKVETGAVTPGQANAMLQELGMTHETVLTKMTGFFEGVEKNVGAQFRRVGAAQLDDVLSQNPFPAGSTQWGQEALGQINDALRNGKISGDVFMNRRVSVLSQVKDAVKLEARTSTDVFKTFDNWIARALSNRHISRVEAKSLKQWAAQQQEQ